MVTHQLRPEKVRGMDNVPTNFAVSGTFRSMGQHLSDGPHDLVSRHHLWLRKLEVMVGYCPWCGSSCSNCVPSLKFVGLPIRQIWRTSALSISQPVTLIFELLTLKLVCIIARGVDNLPTIFDVSELFVSTYGRCFTWHRYTLTFVVMALVGDTSLRTPSVYQVSSLYGLSFQKIWRTSGVNCQE